MIHDEVVEDGDACLQKPPNQGSHITPRWAFRKSVYLGVGADTEEASMGVATNIDETESDETRSEAGADAWVIQLLTRMDGIVAKRTYVIRGTLSQDKAFLLQLYRENYSAERRLWLCSEFVSPPIPGRLSALNFLRLRQAWS